MLLLCTDTVSSTKFNTRSYDLYNSGIIVYGLLIQTLVDFKDNRLAAPPLFYLLSIITWGRQLQLSLVQLLRSQCSPDRMAWPRLPFSKKGLNLQNNKYLLTVKPKFTT
jgi:hypothetical protein